VLQASRRLELLRFACSKHNQLTKEASTGAGIDRHLLGLRLQLRPHEVSGLFADELFELSQEWKLSTSGLSAGERFQATGYIHQRLSCRVQLTCIVDLDLPTPMDTESTVSTHLSFNVLGALICNGARFDW
jgi:hypothetical protein